VKYGACAAAAADGTAPTEAAARFCSGKDPAPVPPDTPALDGAAVGALANLTVTGSVLPSGIVPFRCLIAASASWRLS